MNSVWFFVALKIWLLVWRIFIDVGKLFLHWLKKLTTLLSLSLCWYFLSLFSVTWFRVDLDRDDTRANLTVLFDELIKNKSKKNLKAKYQIKLKTKYFIFSCRQQKFNIDKDYSTLLNFARMILYYDSSFIAKLSIR